MRKVRSRPPFVLSIGTRIEKNQIATIDATRSRRVTKECLRKRAFCIGDTKFDAVVCEGFARPPLGQCRVTRCRALNGLDAVDRTRGSVAHERVRQHPTAPISGDATTVTDTRPSCEERASKGIRQQEYRVESSLAHASDFAHRSDAPHRPAFERLDPRESIHEGSEAGSSECDDATIGATSRDVAQERCCHAHIADP